MPEIHEFFTRVELDAEFHTPVWEVAIRYVFYPAVGAVMAYSGGGSPQAPEPAHSGIVSVAWRRLKHVPIKRTYEADGAWDNMPDHIADLFGINDGNDSLVDLLVQHAEE